MYTKIIRKALSKAKKQDMPWEYFTFGQSLTDLQVAEIRGAKVKRDGVFT